MRCSCKSSAAQEMICIQPVIERGEKIVLTSEEFRHVIFSLCLAEGIPAHTPVCCRAGAGTSPGGFLSGSKLLSLLANRVCVLVNCGKEERGGKRSLTEHPRWC